MHRKDTIELLVLSGIWGSSYLFIAFGGESLPPITLVAIRLLIGAGALQLVLRLRGIALPRAPKVLAALAFMGLMNNIVPFTLITWAETPGPQQVNSGLAAVLIAAVPIFTTILAHFALKDERFTALRVIGVVIGFAGVVVLMSPRLNGISGDQELLGALAVVAAALAYGVAAIFSRRVLTGVAPIVLGAVQMTWSSLTLLPIALLLERPVLADVTARAWFSVVWLGLLGSGLAYIFYFSLIRNIGATRATIVTYISPIVAVILGALFNAEPIHWTLMVGMVLIISGAVIVNRKAATMPGRGEAVTETPRGRAVESKT
jgi:drug/metabolite transporter (DMT)-like permease